MPNRFKETQNSSSATPFPISIKDTLESASNIPDLKQVIGNVLEEINKFEKKVKNNINKQSKVFKDDIDLIRKENERDIKSLQSKYIEIFGVFVGIFSFISLSFTFLKDTSNYLAAISFIIIIGGILLCLLTVIEFILDKDLKQNYMKFAILLAVAIFLLWYGGEKLDASMKNAPRPYCSIN